MDDHPSLWTSLLAAAGLPVPDAMVMATMAFAALVVLAVVGGRRLSINRPSHFQQVLELGVGTLARLAEDLVPHHPRRHLKVIGTFAFFILTCNLMGLIPTFTPATQHYSVTLPLAVLSFGYYNLVGLRAQGPVNYVKHFFGPVLFLAPLMLVIELISHLARNFSLSLRLFGNIFGEHAATGVFYTMAGGFLLPIPMMFLGLFGAFLQTFIFAMLSLIYISMASEH